VSSATPAALESRLASLPVHVLRERLELAVESLALYAKNPRCRLNAIREVEECKAALRAKGYPVPGP